MEAFQLLSRGGANFDKQRFKNDVKLFNVSQAVVRDSCCLTLPDLQTNKSKDVQSRAVPSVNDGELPLELDFFKYAQGVLTKRKAPEQDKELDVKRRKTSHVHEDEDESEDSDHSYPEDLSHLTPPPPKHRVTTKGSGVPEPISSFDALKDRYAVSSRLLSNLVDNGYTDPTGIQSYGIPTLLEVSVSACGVCGNSDSTSLKSRDVAAISPTGTGKTLSYLLPIMAALGTPNSSSKADTRHGVRAVIIAPTRELSHQIHNECLKLAVGRKWRIILFSKSTASTLADKNVRDKVGT